MYNTVSDTEPVYVIMGPIRLKKKSFLDTPPQWEYRNQGPPDCELDMTCVISEAYVRRRKEREKDGHV